MLAVTDTPVMKSVEAEGVHLGKFVENLCQDFDEEIPIRSEGAQHAPMGKLFQVDGGNLSGVGRDATPVRMRLVNLSLQGGRIDPQNSDAETLVLGDLTGESVEGNVGTAAVQQTAVVIRVEGIHESHLADCHTVTGRPLTSGRVHHREGIARANRLLHPGRNLDLPKGGPLEGLGQDCASPDCRRCRPRCLDLWTVGPGLPCSG
jgi:hypothetical protein